MSGSGDALSDILGAPVDPSIPVVSLLIDGDIIAYRAAAATDGRQYKVTGFKQTFDYKKEAVEWCEEQNISVDLIELSFVPEPVSHALQTVKHLMNGIKCNLGHKFPNSKLVTYLTGNGNYRKEINPGYKGSRKGKRVPEHLKACKEFMMKKYDATWEYGLEADDLLTLRATALGVGNFCICSIDKDLKQMPGLHYDFVNDVLVEVTYEEAMLNLWTQVIAGDSTDTILTPRGLGKVAGQKLYANVLWDQVTHETLLTLATQSYCSKMKKTLDHSDVACWVEQTYEQVYLLRTPEEKEEALALLEDE